MLTVVFLGCVNMLLDKRFPAEHIHIPKNITIGTIV